MNETDNANTTPSPGDRSASDSVMRLQSLGKYKLVRRLATGGMGELFLAAVHGEAGFVKPVVIKRLHPHVSMDEDFVQMFIDEARISSQLAHSNICQVLDLGVEGSDYFIAMEYINGPDLAALQARCAEVALRFPLDAALLVISEVLDGLDHAHRRRGADGRSLGIVHRDISPQNILISLEGEVKIIDFGIAKARNRLARTEAGVIKGKYLYMSPEQAQGRRVDHRADIYSTAMVLYELLRGESPFAGLEQSDVFEQLRKPRFEPLCRFRDDVSPELDQVIRTALSVKPAARHDSARTFRAALDRAHSVSFDRAALAGLVRGQFPEEVVELAPERLPDAATALLEREVSSTGVTDPAWLLRQGDDPLEAMLGVRDTQPAPPPVDAGLAHAATVTMAAWRDAPSYRVTRREQRRASTPPAGEQEVSPEPAAPRVKQSAPSPPAPVSTAVFRGRGRPLAIALLLAAVALLLALGLFEFAPATTHPSGSQPQTGPSTADAALAGDAPLDHARVDRTAPLRGTRRRLRRAHTARFERPGAAQQTPPVAQGRLRVNTIHAADVSVDGWPVGQAPGLVIELPAGRYEVQAYFHALERAAIRQVTVAPGQTTVVFLRPPGR